MIELLRALARAVYKKNLTLSRPNWLHLEISNKDRKLYLIFRNKPPACVRNEVRVRGFRWSRKFQRWHAFLNKNRLEDTKKLYRFIYKS